VREYVIVDVFTDVPLEGNALAVFLDGEGLGGELMQRAARELNLSETVFLLPGEGEGEGEGDGDGDGDGDGNGDESANVRARIFTPAVELPFAGHPVLGTAFVVAERLGTSLVGVQTAAGLVPVTLTREGDAIVSGEMEQPIPTWEPLTSSPELLAALGVERSELPIEVYSNGSRHAFVALSDAAAVASVRPDMAALASVGKLGVSCFTASGPRVKTRMFGPAIGVPEDPATGSAAGPLAVHLARHGRIGFGERIEIRQGAEIGRPSILQAVADGSPERIERVAVGGRAVVVARGEYRLD
jgi:trans-2,3-dihydro-3-hydroxyanthranilate isomerase